MDGNRPGNSQQRLMKVNHGIAVLKKMGAEDNNFVDAPPEQLVDFVWELTCELWSLKGSDDAERRLQRNITSFLRQ